MTSRGRLSCFSYFFFSPLLLSFGRVAIAHALVGARASLRKCLTRTFNTVSSPSPSSPRAQENETTQTPGPPFGKHARHTQTRVGGRKRYLQRSPVAVSDDERPCKKGEESAARAHGAYKCTLFELELGDPADAPPLASNNAPRLHRSGASHWRGGRAHKGGRAAANVCIIVAFPLASP